ncbi:MAG: hypothetical protein RIQ81_2303 [Pseudomonadota bacterium]
MAVCLHMITITNVMAQNPALPPPAEVLAQAALGPADMIRIISIVDPAIAEIPDKQTLYGYLLTLPELRRLASSYDFDSFGGSPVDPFAARITRAAAKWIDLFEDSEEVINVFLKFASDQIRYSAGEEQTARVIVESDIEKLLVWQKKARLALLTLREVKAQVYVTESYESVQGIVVARIFGGSSSLDSRQVDDLLSNLDSRAAVESLLEKTAALLSSAASVPEFNRLLEIAVGLNKQAGRVEDRVVADAISGPASLFCVEILVRIASIGLVPDLSFADRIPESLNGIQATNVAGRVAGLKVALIKEEQAEFFFDLVNGLITRCEALGLRQDAAALAPLAAQLAPLLLFVPSTFEGTYQVQVGSQPGRLTLLDSGNGELMLGFSLNSAQVRVDPEPDGSTGAGVVSFSIFSIAFNKATGMFEGAHRTPRSSLYPTGPSANMLVQFSLTVVDGKSVISGRLSSAGATWSGFQGFRVETTVSSAPNGDASPGPSGSYRCIGSDTFCALNIVNQIQFFSGNIVLDDRYMTIPLPYGFFDTRRRLLFMNSLELASGSFVQLRGSFSEGGKYFHGQYTVAGIGSPRKFEMERVDENVVVH